MKYYKTSYLTYIWYLNDVIEGGETEFFGNYKIKPEVGKLVLFPACWSFPHCGLMPISSNKYIITGWLYLSFNEKLNKIIKSIELKEQLDAFALSLPSFITSTNTNDEEQKDNAELNTEEEKEEKEFRKSYNRVYYLS